MAAKQSTPTNKQVEQQAAAAAAAAAAKAAAKAERMARIGKRTAELRTETVNLNTASRTVRPSTLNMIKEKMAQTVSNLSKTKLENGYGADDLIISIGDIANKEPELKAAMVELNTETATKTKVMKIDGFKGDYELRERTRHLANDAIRNEKVKRNRIEYTRLCASVILNEYQRAWPVDTEEQDYLKAEFTVVESKSKTHTIESVEELKAAWVELNGEELDFDKLALELAEEEQQELEQQERKAEELAKAAAAAAAIQA